MRQHDRDTRDDGLSSALRVFGRRIDCGLHRLELISHNRRSCCDVNHRPREVGYCMSFLHSPCALCFLIRSQRNLLESSATSSGQSARHVQRAIKTSRATVKFYSRAINKYDGGGGGVYTRACSIRKHLPFKISKS